MKSLGRMAIAAVWLYQGGWSKLARPKERHLAIVEGLPLVGPARARTVLSVIGAAEVGLGLWVLSGRAPRLAAAAQTAALGAMNGGGLLFSGKEIPDAGAMLTQNLALIALIWSSARR
jgi:uncharacterized membrane protein YphA (DoxX/SURF4 family)